LMRYDKVPSASSAMILIFICIGQHYTSLRVWLWIVIHDFWLLGTVHFRFGSKFWPTQRTWFFAWSIVRLPMWYLRLVQSVNCQRSLHSTAYTVTATIKNNGTVAGHEVRYIFVIFVDVPWRALIVSTTLFVSSSIGPITSLSTQRVWQHFPEARTVRDCNLQPLPIRSIDMGCRNSEVAAA
jgi:hypothetical protein